MQWKLSTTGTLYPTVDVAKRALKLFLELATYALNFSTRTSFPDAEGGGPSIVYGASG